MNSSSNYFNNTTKVIIRHRVDGLIETSLLNGEASARMEEGQEVYLSGDNTVSLRTATQIPVGKVCVPADSGEKAVVACNFTHILENGAASGAVTSGQLLVPTGALDALKRPIYIAAVAGQLANAIAITSAADTEPLRVGQFFAHIVAP